MSSHPGTELKEQKPGAVVDQEAWATRKQSFGHLYLLYVALTVVIFGAMIVAGWYAWTHGIIPGGPTS